MENNHIVSSFDSELNLIQDLILKMGALVCEQISTSSEALLTRDKVLAQKVVKGDGRIDDYETEIDDLVVKLIAKRQPMAQDLRIAVVSMKISSNLERIGDYTKNIAKRTSVIDGYKPSKSSARTAKSMARLVESMLRDTLSSYKDVDAKRAEEIRLRDEDVDQMNNSIFREQLTYMMEDARNITACMHLLFIAKNLERIGDHITTIAEQVIFLATGEVPDDDRPKSDVTSTLSSKDLQDSAA